MTSIPIAMDKKEKGEYVLAIFRILIGWIMFWPFLDKLFGLGYATPAGYGYVDGGSPSSFVVYVTSGIFKDFYTSIAGNDLIDILLLLGCLILGLTLILGIASKLTSIFTTIFLLIMYSLSIPPADNPLIDYHIILIFGLWAIYFLNGYDKLSLYEKWRGSRIVKRLPILE